MAIFKRALKSVDVLIEGATVLEYFPFLINVPMWLPGTSFLRRLAEDRKFSHMLRDLPWNQAKEVSFKSCFSVSLHISPWLMDARRLAGRVPGL